MIQIIEVNGKPFISRITANRILENDLPFEYKNRIFKVKTMDKGIYTPCMICNLGHICDENLSHICSSFDKYAKKNHYLYKVYNQ